jgi:hypothetical protein
VDGDAWSASFFVDNAGTSAEIFVSNRWPCSECRSTRRGPTGCRPGSILIAS